jgi:hypothetical protein
MAIRMGYWDCPACGKKKNPGPERGCPQCGTSRDPSVSFYTEDDAPAITDAALLERAKAGADWVCPYCGADNAATRNACVGCGAVMDGAKHREARYIPDQPPPPTSTASAKPRRLLPIVLMTAAVLFGAIYLLFIRTRAVTVAVARSSWVKTVQVEDLVTQHASAWRSEVPHDARITGQVTKERTRRVQSGTEKLKVGKKDLGNGMFEDVYENKPKYVEQRYSDEWVSYDVDRWVQGRTLKEERSDGSEPPYPAFAAQLGQREAGRSSEIRLELSGGGKSYEFTEKNASAASLARYKVGARFTAKVNLVGSITELVP